MIRMADKTHWRKAASFYLIVQGVGAVIWWTLLLAHPDLRRYFLPADCPDVALLAFGVSDGLLFIGLSFVCAFGLMRGRVWTGPFLCVHAGASVYAALYCVTLTLLTHGQAMWGALLMLPALIVPPYLAYILRQGGSR